MKIREVAPTLLFHPKDDCQEREEVKNKWRTREAAKDENDLREQESGVVIAGIIVAPVV